MSPSHLIRLLRDSIPPVHRDGHKFIAIGAALTLLLFYLLPLLGWIALLLTLWVAYFFRDPARVTPLRDGLILAPADGRITAVEKVHAPPELALEDAPRVRISTCLSLFDVHINRAPAGGRVTRSSYIPGAFLNATADKASEENERRALVITLSDGTQIGVVQIAGLVSRRIVTFAHEGDGVSAGQRFGLIRFGSRVDLYLPPGVNALVASGQRAIAGETVMADLKAPQEEREMCRN